MSFTGNGITNCYPDQVDNFISITVPTRPVIQQSLAEGNRPSVHGGSQTVPYFGLREHVRRSTLMLLTPIPPWPIVANGVPNGQRAVRMCEYDDPRRIGRPKRLSPDFFCDQILRARAHRPRRPVYARPNDGRLLSVDRTRRESRRHSPIDLCRPTSGQHPPRGIQQKALSKTVVARDEVHPRRELHLHRWCRAHVLELEVLQHARLYRLQVSNSRTRMVKSLRTGTPLNVSSSENVSGSSS